MKILKACQLKAYDERTGIREQEGALGVLNLDWIQEKLDKGKVRIEPGLLGWPPYNATAFVEGVSLPFHVEVEGIEESTPTNATPDERPNPRFSRLLAYS